MAELGVNATTENGTQFQAWPWFAVRVRERHRQVAEGLLRARDVLVFSPRCKQTRVWSDRAKVMERVPLFPGYVFCGFEPEQARLVSTTPGVIDIVKVGMRLAEVDAGELSAIWRAVHEAQAVEVVAEAEMPSLMPSLMLGQRVRVARGPLAGVAGVLREGKTGVRLVLAVTMMQRSVSVQVDAADVEALVDA